jgi:signal transduction histidine kinase
MDRSSGSPVPLRGLAISLGAMTAALGTATMWPDLLIDQETIAGSLALVPALLLAHYRGWSKVSVLLGLGLVGLTVIHLMPVVTGIALRGPFLILFAVTPYISIALGAGWFGEVRRYQAELRDAQLQLIQAEKLESLGRLAAGVAHELKNPLMMLLTGVKVLSSRQPAPDEAGRQLLQDMSDAVVRADTIIAGLLNYSRAGGLDTAATDLHATIEESLRFVAHQLDGARIAVVRQFDESMPQLPLDRFKIQQVFVNLVTNAIHAMGPGGELRVRTSLERLTRGPNVGHRRTDRYVPGERVAVVKVEDSGPGIRGDHLDKVFDPFFTTKPTGQGTGLGLSVARQIVEMHGGTIEIANRDEGGVRVTIVLKVDARGGAA